MSEVQPIELEIDDDLKGKLGITQLENQIVILQEKIKSLTSGMEEVLLYANSVHRDLLVLRGEKVVTQTVQPHVGQELMLELTPPKVTGVRGPEEYMPKKIVKRGSLKMMHDG